MGNVLTPARRLFYRGQNPRSMRTFPAEPGALRRGALRRAARSRQAADFAPPRYNVGGAVRCAAARGGT